MEGMERSHGQDKCQAAKSEFMASPAVISHHISLDTRTHTYWAVLELCLVVLSQQPYVVDRSSCKSNC